jgi:hypothetical protein
VTKPASPDLKTTEEGGATEATPTAVAKKTPTEGRKYPTVAFMAETKGHWTSECPLVKEKKEELD